MSGVVTIIGQGYVGLPLAVSAARAGWSVHGVEISQNKFDLLTRGISPVEDISSAEIQTLVASRHYQVHSDFVTVSESDVVVICVPTPIDDNQKPDLRAIKGACSAILENIEPGCLVINESTSFPGTLRNLIIPMFQAKGSREGVFFATAPERIDPGNRTWTQENTPRLVGGIDKESLERAVTFYESFCKSVVPVTSPEVAEMAKLLENSFRLINIGFINELSFFAHKLGVDVREVVEAAATKPYGFMPFYPSAGIGGHCIPVDPYYLLQTMTEENVRSRVLEAAAQSNLDRTAEILNLASELSEEGVQKLLIIGVAYKSGISDTRESASEKIAKKALSEGIKVYWHDPMVDNWNYGEKWNQQSVDAAIMATLQPGDENIYRSINAPILDCTGTLKGKPGVTVL